MLAALAVFAGAAAIALAASAHRSHRSGGVARGASGPRTLSITQTACVDRRFHTIAARSGRLLVELSAGGYGAMNIGLRDLGSFGAVESWSEYFIATDPSEHHVLQLGSAAARRAAQVAPGATG